MEGRLKMLKSRKEELREGGKGGEERLKRLLESTVKRMERGVGGGMGTTHNNSRKRRKKRD